MKIINGKRKRNGLVVKIVVLIILTLAISKIIRQRMKIMKLEEENKKISAIINDS